MKTISSNSDGVIFGKEHDSPLFIRKVTFHVGYTESEDHTHPNSYEYYLILSGELTFISGDDAVNAKLGDIVYFATNESHRISQVTSEVRMLLFKQIGAKKA